MPQIRKVCEQCKGEFAVHRYRSTTARYCSVPCSDRAKVTGGIDSGGYMRGSLGKREHVLIVERVLGRPLPAGAVTHHVNAIRSDNRNENLCVLQSQTDHLELHRKMRVRAAGGDPWADRLCSRCGPRPAQEFYLQRDTRRGARAHKAYCRACNTVVCVESQRRRNAA